MRILYGRFNREIGIKTLNNHTYGQVEERV